MTNASDKQPQVLIFGLGYTGRAVAQALVDSGWQVSGTGRTAPDWPGVRGIVFDSDTRSELRDAIINADVIISSIPPGQDGFDPVLEAFPGFENICEAKAVIYLSATSVYGDRKGQWVFEDESPRPQTRRGKARAEAELRWLETGLPVYILRLAGIYGPDDYGQGRSAFNKMERAVIKPGHVVNRIHVEDIAALALKITRRASAGLAPGLYNVADGQPAPPQDVVDLAAEMAGAPWPRRVDWTDTELSKMARSFYAETKRVDISKAKRVFGWTPKFTDYRLGLSDIWARRQAIESEDG